MTDFGKNNVPIYSAIAAIGSAIFFTAVILWSASDMKAQAKADTQAVADQVSHVALDVAVTKVSLLELSRGQSDLKEGQRALWDEVKANTIVLNEHSQQLGQLQGQAVNNELNRKDAASRAEQKK